MTFTVKFVVLRGGEKRTITVDFAGCTDEYNALQKLADHYTGVQKVTSVTPKGGKT